MDISYESITSWLDTYFEDCNRSQGAVADVKRLAKYFTDDYRFHMYTAPPFVKTPLSRTDFLMLFVHPGLYEGLRPQYYVIDVHRLMVVVKFEFDFVEEESGRRWESLSASAHYHLVQDDDSGLRIKMIEYWTQSSPDDRQSLFDSWLGRKEKALVEYASREFMTPP